MMRSKLRLTIWSTSQAVSSNRCFPTLSDAEIRIHIESGFFILNGNPVFDLCRLKVGILMLKRLDRLIFLYGLKNGAVGCRTALFDAFRRHIGLFLQN